MSQTELIERPAIETYEPSPPQYKFHQAREDHRRRWFVAGIQSGKTEPGAVEAFMFATKYAPGGKGAIFGPDYPKALEARDRFNEVVPYEWRRWNGSERIWKIRAENGAESTVYWRSMHDPDAPRGLVLDWAWLDECAMYSEEGWNNLRRRVAVKQGHIWGTSTPRGRNWLWKQAVQKAEPDDLLVHCRSIDNPLFPLPEWEKLTARYGKDSPFFRQEYLGQFTAFVGQAILQFDRTKHVDRFEWKPDWTLIRCWDFGFSAPTVALWLQIDPDENVYVIGEQLWTETHRDVVLANVRCRDIPKAAPKYEAIDPSGASGRAPEAHDRGWRDAMERQGLDVRWTRHVGETRGLNLIRQWAQQGKLFVDERCPRTIEALEVAELDANPEKDRLKDNQHPHVDVIDALRYGFAMRFGRDPAPKFTVVR